MKNHIHKRKAKWKRQLNTVGIKIVNLSLTVVLLFNSSIYSSFIFV